VTIVRVGSNKKFANGWESAFGKKTAKKPTVAKGGAKKSAKGASAKKKTKKKK